MGEAFIVGARFPRAPPWALPSGFAPRARAGVEEASARKRNAESTRAATVATGGRGSESEFRESGAWPHPRGLRAAVAPPLARGADDARRAGRAPYRGRSRRTVGLAAPA